MIDTEIGTVPAAKEMIEGVAAHIAQVQKLTSMRSPNRLPVCDHIPEALRAARAARSEVANMAGAFETLAPDLGWGLRARAAEQGNDFLHGHANALIFGHGDFSVPERVTLGVTLMAPGVSYPDHSHPPEELYIVLSSGEWRQDCGAWVRHGPGGLVHNPPGVNHGMRAGASPLLALWLLWNEKA
jgi:quercetin dioxygenase-like cupin family protein